MNSVSVVSSGVGSTHALAHALAPLLRAGSVLCLDGDLGAGKTTFVNGLARALEASEPVTSPTFTLENRYPVPNPSVGEIVHVDLYRPGGAYVGDLLASILEARATGAIVAVEWGQPIKESLEPYLQVDITWGEVPDDRRFSLTPNPAGWLRLPELAEAWCARGVEP